MFGGGFWGAPLGNDDHLTRERDPPPRPIELEFPDYVPAFNPRPLTKTLSSKLQHKICHAKTFLDISNTDVESLNIKFQKDASISELLPNDQFTDRPLPFDDELQAMLDEIGTENEDAFREVLRLTPLEGRKKPKLAYARNFFGSLEDMARYFDDSQDDYYKVPVTTSENKTELPKSQSQSASCDKDVSMKDAHDQSSSADEPNMKEVYKGYRLGSAESLSPGTRVSMLKNLLKTTMHRFQCRDHEPIPQPREKFVVRGVKIQAVQYQFCVARMPQDVKMARARQVEGPIMAVATRDDLRFKEKTGLRMPDKVPFVGERFDLFREIGCLLIIAAQRAREGKEKSTSVSEKWWESRPRWGGGPTTWGQLACEIYEDEDPSWSPEERKLQERKRQQQAEDKAKAISNKSTDPKKLEVEDLIADDSADTTKAALSPSVSPGATPAIPVIPTDLDIRPKKKKLRSMDRPPGDEAAMRDGKRLMYVPPFKKRWYQDWQRLRPNMSMIDDKIISKRIGAEHEEFDEVFLLTSVNHHVALVKMKVHPDYLAWLESGREVPDDEVDGLKKNVLYVSRTTWFNMLDVKTRKEFLIGLWRLFCWINRDYVPKEEYERMKQE